MRLQDWAGHSMDQEKRFISFTNVLRQLVKTCQHHIFFSDLGSSVVLRLASDKFSPGKLKNGTSTH